MSDIRTVKIQARLLEGVKVESTIGKHVLYSDQPEEGGGTDAGPTPPDYLFLALAGCIGSLARTLATRRGITIRSMEMTIQGDLDIDAILGDAQKSKTGFERITMTVDLDADLSPEEKTELLREAERRCPVSDTIKNITALSVQVQ
jgi:uncharacterized OsmC-like protein